MEVLGKVTANMPEKSLKKHDGEHVLLPDKTPAYKHIEGYRCYSLYG